MRATVVVPTIRETSPTLDCLSELSMPDVEIAEQRDPRSLNHARNAGVAEASSDHIVILDDDLSFTGEWLEARIEQAERSAASRTIWGARGTGILDRLDWSGTGFTPILGRVMVFDRAVWRAVGGFPAELHHGGDTVFALRAARAGWTVEPLAHDFEHHDTVDEYSLADNARWLWTLARHEPRLLVPRLPTIAIAAARDRLAGSDR